MGLRERVRSIGRKTDPREDFERTYGHDLTELGRMFNQRGMIGTILPLNLNGNWELVHVDVVRRDFLMTVVEGMQKQPEEKRFEWLKTLFTDLDRVFPPGKRMVIKKK